MFRGDCSIEERHGFGLESPDGLIRARRSLVMEVDGEWHVSDLALALLRLG
jgi:hypothetical protein